MPRQISSATKSKVSGYNSSSLAMLIVSYAIENSWSINDIAEAAGVSRMTISNWVNGSETRGKNLAELILKLDLEQFVDSIITPDSSLNSLNANTVKKHAELQKEWGAIKQIIEKIKLELSDPGKQVLARKYFKYFGSKILQKAYDGLWNYDPLVLPWDLDDIKKITTQDEYYDFCMLLQQELEEDGFNVSIAEKEYPISLLSSDAYSKLGLDESYQLENLKSLQKSIDAIYQIEIDWLGVNDDYDNIHDGEDNFAWFLEWLHTPGRIIVDLIFSKIKVATISNQNKLDLPLYSICEDDYDEEERTELRNDEFSYRDDSFSLYYEGHEIPVNEVYLREFFAFLGYKFYVKRNFPELNKHVACISWA